MIEQIGRSQSAKFGFVQHVKHMTKTTNLRKIFILRSKPIQDLTETGQRRYMCDFVSKKNFVGTCAMFLSQLLLGIKGNEWKEGQWLFFEQSVYEFKSY